LVDRETISRPQTYVNDKITIDAIIFVALRRVPLYRARMKLDTYLTQADLTQREFAKRAGLTEATVSRLVNGLQQPGAATLRAIMRETNGAVGVADFETEAA
jgi:DNA-binding XRE family transcriptional regulator